MKVLFISRAYPPIIGGIENQNYELGKWLGEIADVKIIANKKGKKFLPFFLPYAIFQSLFIAHKYDVILLGDGVLGIAGWFLKLFYKKPAVCIVHGLDLTYRNKIYQKFWVRKFIKRLDKLIAVGNETVRIASEKGIFLEKITFIPNGIDTEKYLNNYSRQEIERIIDEPIEDKKFILTFGRLAKRKGVAWFVRNVLPKLPDNIVYIVAGNGPDKKNIRDAVRETGLEKRVKLLGSVTDKVRNILFNTCDIFVQPNIKVEGDVEGFGISVIEAGSCKIPVVAANLEGLKDAIKDNQDGFLAEPENPESYVQIINKLLADDNYRKEFGEKARQFIIENYSWKIISQKYLEEIKETAKQTRPLVEPLVESEEKVISKEF